ncbi:beta-ketoacyl-[acyl-carrier-protein] synthase family protein [Pseudozobellia thermophila]|uniref:3-oxoacyl-[acyl-carrier-protein] synthase 1 n=1 Tax=Pseudozobellia thermophila TaxID=192903 RepID=A0A1M6PAN7_9FLAO|nr:beta-ketoacyl-[acyl-carrier-protein] synthase family protein [Pseudozobellia thermophila]SHK05006.1 3-oxoacyl-(acyl-carrier-protein) synthase [Pseudozobellia thermophila]
MDKRVVITGLGVCAPNAVGIKAFSRAMAEGKSGIRFVPQLKELGFGCQIAGAPVIAEDLLGAYFTPLQLRDLKATGIIYGVMAGTDAWADAGLAKAPDDAPHWQGGVVFGSGTLGVDKFHEAMLQVDRGEVRRLGSTTVIQTMASGVSAYLGGILGCGNQVTTNSSACTTGTESVLMGYERIVSGQAEYMLVGSCSDSGPYVWSGFDAMRILPRKYNADPEKASRPMSASASGFVPGSGAGALVLESLESARARGAKIYAEVLGGALNSGGQRAGGSMTAPNSEAVQRCIVQAVRNAGIAPEAIDAVNGHLTATSKDALEIENWSRALGREGSQFPYVNSFKGYFGHCLSAAGSIECVASVLQVHLGKVFGNPNCEDLHPEIKSKVDEAKIPRQTLDYGPQILAKASFGFGDVNACVIFKRFRGD